MERKLWRSWTLLLSLIILTALAILTDFVPAVQAFDAYPWAGTPAAVKIGLLVSVLAVAGALTGQHRRAAEARRGLHQALEDANKRIEDNLARLTTMLDVTRTLARETDSDSVFECIVSSCRRIFPSDQVSLMLQDRASGNLQVRAVSGHLFPEKVLGETVPMGEGIAGWVAQHQEPLFLDDAGDIKKRYGISYEGTPLTAALVVPVVNRDEVVGVLCVSSREADTRYNEEHLQSLLIFAEHAGVAVRHAEQAEWTRLTLDRLDTLDYDQPLTKTEERIFKLFRSMRSGGVAEGVPGGRRAA
jgi:transcriptional regulator with GAF, ATPase, and Fis domain